MKKQFKVVMLPTKKANPLCIKKNGELEYSGKIPLYGIKELGFKPQLLIIISDEEIEIGDSAYIPNGMIQYEHVITVIENDTKNIIETLKSLNASKIIASSDKKLTPECWIPESFLSAYVKSYNANESIKEVSLELVEYYDFKAGDKLKTNCDLYGIKKGSEITVKKFNHRNENTLIEFEEDDEHNLGIQICHLIHTTSKEVKTRADGSVIVHRNKTYSEEEVKAIAQEAWIESFFKKRNTDITGFKEWFEKQLNN